MLGAANKNITMFSGQNQLFQPWKGSTRVYKGGSIEGVLSDNATHTTIYGVS